MANEYVNGKIYLITVGDERYVGSTVQTLEARMSGHRTSVNRTYQRRLYDAIEAVGWDAVNMTLLEAYPCSSADELRWRERHWFDLLQPELNTWRPAVTEAEREEQRRLEWQTWYAANKDAVASRKAAYRAANPDKQQQYEKQRYASMTDEEHTAKVAYNKEWRHANADAVAEKSRAYLAANRDSINARRMASYHANKEAISAKRRAAYAAKKAAAAATN